MYLTATKDHWACDIEADHLLEQATKVHCLVLINALSKETVKCRTKEDFKAFADAHPDAIYFGHNFISYDAPMLNRFWAGRMGISRIVDTFVLSQMYSPTLKGGHSLAAWGERLKFPKTDFHEFEKFTEEMMTYCVNDTRLTLLLFLKLTERMRQVGFTERGCEIEHKAWHIIQNKQRRNGFPFNYKEAMALYVTLKAREKELQNEIYKLWPPELLVVAEYKKSHKVDGSPTKDYERHSQQYAKVEQTADGGYRVFDYVAFNLGSPIQRIEKLLELGWIPTSFTPKTKSGGGGNPQVDEDSLLSYAASSGRSEVTALSKWIVINSRSNMIKTWMDAYNDKTKAIHGSLFIASTLRYRHSGPNSANIPAVRLAKVNEEDVVQYGEDGGYSYEARNLWDAGEDPEFTLVGIDGTGIQNRCLIHSLIKTVGEDAVREFKTLALEGDVHKKNIEILGLANKAAAKKFYYTLMMGGQGARLAADQAQFGTKMTAREGKEKREMMIASIPGFGALISSLEEELARKGRIKLCDGTPLLVPSPHMVIPYLLQGDESRLMKQALIYVDEEVRRHRLTGDVFKVADIHDEWQWRVRTSIVTEFAEMALACFPRAGDSFNYNIIIEGDYKEGKTWALTH